MLHRSVRFALFLLAVLTLFACGSAPTEPTATKVEALNWQSVSMNIATGTHCPANPPGYCVINEDSTFPTPDLTTATMLAAVNTANTYNVASHTAVFDYYFNPPGYTEAVKIINSPGNHGVSLIYNADAPGNVKPIVQGPYFF